MTSPTLHQLLHRSSIPKLTTPGPDNAELEQIVQAGLRAPDHAYLRPTRIHQVHGDGLTRLGALFVEALQSDEPEAGSAAIEKVRHGPQRAPLVLVVGCHTQFHKKVPAVEQLASSAAAVSLMQTAIDALGYASMWRTGPMAYHPMVKEAFGLEEKDHLVAFLYVGTANGAPKKRQPTLTEDYLGTF